MKLYRLSRGFLIEDNGHFYSHNDNSWTTASWDGLITRDDLHEHLTENLKLFVEAATPPLGHILPPIGNQEVWACGVTYMRSREARMEEAKTGGGGDFYDRVYNAPRPELFFKTTAHRVVGTEGLVAIREDATLSVPEPELTLLITPSGKVTGYTIGNDMSSRDIEGENPLYLPQAKIYDRCCSIGPCILLSHDPLPRTTEIRLEIFRDGQCVFAGGTTLDSMKREPAELVSYLMRSNKFPLGCFLMTGTGIIPPDDFGLKHNDEIRIGITGIGTLVNRVG
jgi:2-dehydro-3-deoxy-D-arabinonate dehydratase